MNNYSHVLIILGHPSQESLCHRLMTEYAAGAAESGATVDVLELGEIAFDPVMRNSYRKPAEAELEPGLVHAQNLIQQADHIVIISPIWWGEVPALLKGFFDRILLPGFAYKYHQKTRQPQRLLKGKTARVILTMDSPVWWYQLVQRAPAYQTLRHLVLGFCGVRPVRFTSFGEVKFASPEKIEGWIKQVYQLGAALA